jgi:hypothetical protein
LRPRRGDLPAALGQELQQEDVIEQPSKSGEPRVGGFETGLRNRMPLDLAFHVRTGRSLRPGREPEDMLLELQALGVQYVVVHGPKSQEYYRDYAHPEWLAAVLPAIWREGDDAIYALPPRPLAHAMRPEDLPGDEAGSHPDRLERYVAALSDRMRTRWLDTTHLVIDGPVSDGALVAVQVNADPGWRGWQDGRPIAIEHDRLGFITLRAAPSTATRIDLRYRGTTEQRVLSALSAAAWIGALAALFLAKMKSWRSKPSGSTRTN